MHTCRAPAAAKDPDQRGNRQDAVLHRALFRRIDVARLVRWRRKLHHQRFAVQLHPLEVGRQIGPSRRLPLRPAAQAPDQQFLEMGSRRASEHACCVGM
jgi:hypothetical protein